MSLNFDVLIKNGKVVDGTGNLGFKADVGIKNGRITAIEQDISPRVADRLIDAAGCVVSPGFIDTHTHDDFLVLVRPPAEEKVRQGVTTLVLGNCGIGLAPLGGEKELFVKGMLGSFGGNDLGDRYLEINTMDDYLRMVEETKPGVNVAPLLGHVNLRYAVMGMENRAPTQKELEDMKKLALEAMESGVFGFSTGLIYAPGNYAATEELIELAKTAAAFGTIYTTHMRSEGDNTMESMAEAFRIGREAKLPVHISHHKLAGRQNWGRSVDTLNFMTAERAMGLKVTCDQYPYGAGSTILAAVLPPKYLADPEFAEKMKNPGIRSQIIEELENDSDGSWENLAKGAGFDNIVISTSSHAEYLGKSVAELAETHAKTSYDMLFDILADEGVAVGMIIFSMGDDDIERIMQSPYTMVGSDGIPGFGVNRVHPRMTGTFPRVLGEYVRSKGVLKLEEAVRKMTSLPAQTFGLKNKGVLTKGYDADLVVFDPLTVKDGSTYDEPGKEPLGIPYVLVNGSLAVDDGELVGCHTGKVLRKT